MPNTGFQTTAPHPALAPSLLADAEVPGYRSLLKEARQNPATSASDCWFFTRPNGETSHKPTSLPDVAPPLYTGKPIVPQGKEAYVSCRLCPLDSKNWTAWKIQNGQTTAIRKHLVRYHPKEYRETVIGLGLKGWEDNLRKTEANDAQQSEVLADDQSINVTSTDEFRDLILYLNADLSDDDIPHRTFLTTLLGKMFKTEHLKLEDDVQNALGRVSFTCDVWSDKNIRGFMGVTLHFINKDERGHLRLRARLGAFRFIKGTHTGVDLARQFVHILRELGILHKIGMLTMDNASSGDTMMEELERLLTAAGIRFHRDGNRIRCFPHVINLAVQAALAKLTEVEPLSTFTFDTAALDDDDTVEDPPIATGTRTALEADPSYHAALLRDPVTLVRKLVSSCRVSRLRRDDFHDTILKGNADGSFQQKLRPVQLLRDMEVRWSSTYLMIDRALELYPAIKKFIELPKYQRDLDGTLLTENELRVLRDIHRLLKLPHRVQELLASEKTPTLALVLPAYEKLIKTLRIMETSRAHQKLGHAIAVAALKLEKYLAKTRSTPLILAIADIVSLLVLNPTIKLQWLQDNWVLEDVEKARKWVIEAMTEYRVEIRTATGSTTAQAPGSVAPPTSCPPVFVPVTRDSTRLASSSRASKAQASGYAELEALMRSYSEDSLDTESSQATASTSGSAGTESVVESPEEREAPLQVEDRQAVQNELDQYTRAGLSSSASGPLDLVFYWESVRSKYPLLFRIAMDVLPIQASAVPCERVFSSSKETDTMRRSRLSAALIETLQVLKFTFRQERLDFRDKWLDRETELVTIHVSDEEIEELMSQGKLSELMSLLNEQMQAEDAAAPRTFPVDENSEE
ncbi:hypothetical protein EUX98_g3511 [Antrodiella citrinella]|uniref:HAT C-terminal dimerisation domain-containing protein n=1 Tax=Antrodiella citrinella TaxID=2447956 RepID=A0A4S4MYG5_9APHY|nr:hypothetical protein EUX98_g3511 [Antrodiella citrinella]